MKIYTSCITCTSSRFALNSNSYDGFCKDELLPLVACDQLNLVGNQNHINGLCFISLSLYILF